jgi:hypothetical protein
MRIAAVGRRSALSPLAELLQRLFREGAVRFGGRPVPGPAADAAALLRAAHAGGAARPGLAWLPRGPSEPELAALTAGALLEVGPDVLRRVQDAASSQEGCRAVAVVRPGLVAAVGPSHIDWLRPDGRRLCGQTTPLPLPDRWPTSPAGRPASRIKGRAPSG